MNLIQKISNSIRSAFATKATNRSTPIELDSNGVPWFWESGYIAGYTFSSYSLREFIINGYAKNPFVFMCIDKIASVSAQLDWEIVNEKTKKPVTDANLLALFDRPNLTQTWDAFYYEAITSLEATGNIFIRKEKAIGYSKPTSLTVLVPYLVEIYTDNGQKYGTPIYYTYDGQVIETEEIIHFCMPNITERTNWGFSALQPGLSAYEASNNIFEAESHLHKNMGITGVLSNKDGNMPMTPKEQQQVQKQWQEANAGARNFGRIMVTTAALEYLKLGMSPEDLQTLEGQLQKMRTICSLFGLDSSLFNDPDNKTFSNRNEAEKSMYETVIKPLTEMVNRWLSYEIIYKDFGLSDTVIKADFSDVACLAEDKTVKHTETIQAVQAGIITPNEARSILYPEMPESQPTQSEPAKGDSLEDDPQAQSANELAQANLRGSVGGVQGILQVQQSVQSGITSESAAIAILVEIYGFDASTARVILGL